MPCVRMMFKMPMRISSPLPPPRGKNASDARMSPRDAASGAVVAACAMRPAKRSCLLAMSLPW